MPLSAYPIMLPTAGIKLDTPSQFLMPNYSPDSRNMEYWEGLMRTRLGLSKEFAESFDGNPVNLIIQFWKKSGEWWLIVCTTKDIYYWDTATKSRKFITPIYNTGTVAVTLNSAIITGTGTLWSTNVKAGDYFRLGGLNDASPIWYEVLTVDSDTQITLKTTYSEASGTGQAYTIRKIFTGTVKDYWRTIVFEDDTLGEVMILSNSRKDNVVRWRGSALDPTVVPLANAPRTQLLETINNRLILMDTIEGGINERQRVRWSDVANCESFPAKNFVDLADDQDWIMAKGIVGDKILILKEFSSYIMRWIGGDETFRFEQRTDIIGTYGHNAVINVAHGLFYWGTDNRFYHFNGIISKPISDNILPFTKDINPNEEDAIYGEYIEYLNQCRWFVTHGEGTKNNYCIVYDTAQDIWEIWEYAHPEALCCVGWYTIEEDLYVNDPVWGELFVSETEGYWDSRVFLEGAPVVLYGGYDGFIRRADRGVDDDGFTYTSYFRSKKVDYELPHFVKRLAKIQPWFNKETGGSVDLRVRLGDKEVWEALKTFSIDDTKRNVVKPTLALNYNDDVFEFEFKTTGYAELLGWLNFVSKRRRTF